MCTSACVSQGHNGVTSPMLLKLTLLHKALAFCPPPLYLSSTCCNKIPLHALLLLQSNLMAISEALVPFIFWYTTFLTSTADLCDCYKIQIKQSILLLLLLIN